MKENTQLMIQLNPESLRNSIKTDPHFVSHNDPPDAGYSSVRLFADDCLLNSEIKNQNDLNKLQENFKSLKNGPTTGVCASTQKNDIR